MAMEKTELSRLAAALFVKIGQITRFCVTAHTHPDGDAVGSSCAMAHYLKSAGKQVKVILPDAIPADLDFIRGGFPVIIAKDSPEEASDALAWCEALICVDFNELSRTACLEEAINACGKPRILIDHHLYPDTGAFDFMISDPEAAATCELIYNIFEARLGRPLAKGDLPRECVQALLSGLTTDTNNFSNPVREDTFKAAAGLLSAGADRNAILNALYQSGSEGRLRMMGQMLSKMKITPEGVAYMVIRLKDIESFGIREDETEGFVNIPLGIGKVRMSVTLKESTNSIRVSIRSKEGTSANRFASGYFHGGGHELASGGRIYIPQDISSPDGAEDFLKDAIKRFFNE